jgi:hypothetical protein
MEAVNKHEPGGAGNGEVAGQSHDCVLETWPARPTGRAIQLRVAYKARPKQALGSTRCAALGVIAHEDELQEGQ